MTALLRAGVALAVCVAFLVLVGKLDEKDQQIAAMEKKANQLCEPHVPGEIAAMAMRKDGTVECAITSLAGGRRVVVDRWSM